MVPDHWMVISQKYFFNLQPINYKLFQYEQYGRNHVSWYARLQTCSASWFQRFQMDKSQVGRFITVGQQIISSRLMVIKTRRMILIRMVINGYKGKKKWGACVVPGQKEGGEAGCQHWVEWSNITADWSHLLPEIEIGEEIFPRK